MGKKAPSHHENHYNPEVQLLDIIVVSFFFVLALIVVSYICKVVKGSRNTIPCCNRTQLAWLIVKIPKFLKILVSMTLNSEFHKWRSNALRHVVRKKKLFLSTLDQSLMLTFMFSLWEHLHLWFGVTSWNVWRNT